MSDGGSGFPRSIRLRRSPDFDRVQRRGRRFHLRHLVVLVLENGRSSPSGLRNSSGGSRFGLAVSRKVGNAVVRNRVKRWLREAVRRQREGVQGVDVVLIARPSAAAAGYHLLYAEVGEVLARLRKESV